MVSGSVKIRRMLIAKNYVARSHIFSQELHLNGTDEISVAGSFTPRTSFASLALGLIAEPLYALPTRPLCPVHEHANLRYREWLDQEPL